jgi:hypothetical protein
LAEAASWGRELILRMRGDGCFERTANDARRYRLFDAGPWHKAARCCRRAPPSKRQIETTAAPARRKQRESLVRITMSTKVERRKLKGEPCARGFPSTARTANASTRQLLDRMKVCSCAGCCCRRQCCVVCSEKKPASFFAGRVMHVDHPRNPEGDRS